MSKKTPLSPEDQALFQKEMQHVTPLKAKKPKIAAERVQQSDPNQRSLHPERHSRHPEHHSRHPEHHSRHPEHHSRHPEHREGSPQNRGLCDDLSDYYANPVQSESLLHYHQPGVSRLQVHALKTGKLSYQAKLDLHGLKPDAAKERLNQFLTQQIQLQHCWVLIIHGKGGRFGEAPVLKNLINRWLPQIPRVLGFHSAQPKHGGAGATYVLLK